MNSFINEEEAKKMPKIIENVRENLIREAREQILRHGYSGMTIRSVAKACELGIGTVYNYFKSKEELIHTLMYEDWLVSIEIIQRHSALTDSPEAILRCIYEQLALFMTEHKCLLNDKNAAKVFALSYVEGHIFLREQLAAYLEAPCKKYAKVASDFLPQFLIEATLVWAAAGKTFEEIYSVLQVHFQD